MFRDIAPFALAGLVLVVSGLAHAEADIGFERATQLALARVPGHVESIERDRERGQEVYEVEIRNDQGVKFEVTLSAQDGKVLDVEQDD